MSALSMRTTTAAVAGPGQGVGGGHEPEFGAVVGELGSCDRELQDESAAVGEGEGHAQGCNTHARSALCATEDPAAPAAVAASSDTTDAELQVIAMATNSLVEQIRQLKRGLAASQSALSHQR